MSEKTYEGFWRCKACGTENDGLNKDCIGCGKAHTTEEYYLHSKGSRVITDPEILNTVANGADWICHHCQSTNPNENTTCSNCSAPKGQSRERDIVDYELGKTPDTAEEAEDEAYERDLARRREHAATGGIQSPKRTSTIIGASDFDWDPQSRSTRRQLPSVNGQHLAWIGAIFLVLSLLFSGWYFFIRTEPVNVTIAGFEWSREIRVDEYRTVREGDWSIPPGGRYVSQEERVHHYRKVQVGTRTEQESYTCGSESYVCGTTNNGDGTFSDRTCSRPKTCTRNVQVPVYEDEPVYRTWYTYDIDKWIYHRSVKTNGTTRDDPEPFWGELILECANQVRLGCERESGRPQEYIVIFIDDEEKTYRHQESRADWDTYDYNGQYVIEVTRLGQIRNDPLRPDE